MSPSRTSIPPAEAVKLLDLVGYQEGSVVSRTLLDRNTGTVTLFAFDENQGLSPHTSPYDALVEVLEGEGEFTVSGKVNRLTQGDLILLPAGKSHAVKALQKFKMLLIMIRFQEEKMEFGEKARYLDMTVSN